MGRCESKSWNLLERMTMKLADDAELVAGMTIFYRDGCGTIRSHTVDEKLLTFYKEHVAEAHGVCSNHYSSKEALIDDEVKLEQNYIEMAKAKLQRLTLEKLQLNEHENRLWLELDDESKKHPLFRDEGGVLRFVPNEVTLRLNRIRKGSMDDLDSVFIDTEMLKKYYREMGYSLGGFLELFHK